MKLYRFYRDEANNCAARDGGFSPRYGFHCSHLVGEPSQLSHCRGTVQEFGYATRRDDAAEENCEYSYENHDLDGYLDKSSHLLRIISKLDYPR